MLFKKTFEKLIGIERARHLINRNLKTPPYEFVLDCQKEYEIKTKVTNKNSAPFKSTIFFCTQHSGTVDFFAAFPALHEIAPDLKVIINNKLNMIPPLDPVSIKINSVSSGIRNTEARKEIDEHLKKGGNLMLFPSGRIGDLKDGMVHDAPWRLGIFEILKNSGASAVPVYINTRNAGYFYIIRKFAKAMDMIFLLTTLNGWGDKTIHVIIGQPVTGLENLSALEALELTRKKTYELRK